MQLRLSVSVVFIALLSLATLSARADTRCGGKLVSEGDSAFQVKNLCGGPDQATQRIEQRVVRRWVAGPCTRQPAGHVQCGYVEEQVVQVTIDEWLYDFGPQSLIRFLTFEQGQLVRIATGGYGTKQS